MTPNPPLKLAVRAAIKAAGGIKVAAHVCGVSETQAGRWNCLTDHDLPRREHCHALDELAMAAIRRAPIIEEQARQLGHVAIPLPEGFDGSEQIAMQLHVAGARLGEAAQVLVDALGDGELDRFERAELAHKCDRVLAAVVQLKAMAVDGEAGAAAASPGVKAA